MRVLSEAGATSSFLGYDIGSGPYPAVICASVNDRVVHGIPSQQDVLRDGDILSLDFGAIIDGWHGDAAVSVLVGEVSDEVSAMSDACERALWAGLARARSGGRLGDISHAVEMSVRDSGRYGIVTGYGGHGIGSAMHMDPHILNYGRAGKGPRLVPGMALAIEPMITLGARGTHRTRGRLDGQHRGRLLGGALGAHGGCPRRRPVGAHRTRRWPCRAGAVRRRGLCPRRLSRRRGSARRERGSSAPTSWHRQRWARVISASASAADCGRA